MVPRLQRDAFGTARLFTKKRPGGYAMQASVSAAHCHTAVFIDSRVADARTLLDGVCADTCAYIVSSASDGLAQIAGAISDAGLADLAAIHVVAHGSPGALELGSTAVNRANLRGDRTLLAAIGGALASDGAIHLYACDVA